VETTTLSRWAFVVLAASLVLLPSPITAQTTASLSGIVSESSGGVISGAKVTAINRATNDRVETVTGNEGTFTFPALLPGTYTVSVEAKGFKVLQQEGLVVTAGARVTVPPIALQIGIVSDTITVQANQELLETSTGQLGWVLSTTDLERLALSSQNALELLKTLPGVALMPNGIKNGVNFDFFNIGAEGSPIGFGVDINGAPPAGGVADLLDGVNINDPGCNCWSIATLLPDMVAEISLQSSNFGADVAHGPVVINAISKSGTSRYHGQAYYYARNDVLNANDWLDNHEGVRRGDATYNYPGGSFGGPVPFTRKKLLFWFGYERFLQNTGNAYSVTSHIPSADMMAGNFTSTAANTALCPLGINSGNNGSYCNDLRGTALPDGTIIGVTPGVPAGRIPPQFLNTPAAIDAQALASVWPTPNVTPTAANGYANFYKAFPGIHDGYIWRVRLDYNFSDRTKAYLSYQRGYDSQPSGGLGIKMFQASVTNGIPFPAGVIEEPNTSKALSGHLVHIFTNTLTYELFGALGYASNPQTISNPSAMYRTTLGYTGGTIFGTGDKWIPSYSTPSTGTQTFPDLSQADVFNGGNRFSLIKETPTIGNNLTKVWGAQTIKVGQFYEMVNNNQGNSFVTNGLLSFSGGPALNAVTNVEIGSPNNPTANFVLGNATGYTENNANPRGDLAYKTISFYVDDSWRASSRLNIEVGFRFDHIGRWYDRGGAGVPVFLPSMVRADFDAGNFTTPGVTWHAINPRVPKSGVTAQLFVVAPRFGIAYDVFGTGKTVIRGGWGRYSWGDQWNDISPALGTAQGVQTFTLPNNISVLLDQIGTGLPNVVTGAHNISPSGARTGCCAGSVTAVNPNDKNIARTDSYNLTIDQHLPWKSHLEISYVGNQTSNALVGGGSQVTLGGQNDYLNQNKMPLGALFRPDPITGVISPDPENIGGVGSPNNKAADYDPYGYAYGSNPIYVLSHDGYANYNALQVVWWRQAKNLAYNLSYTHSKALGTGLSINPFSLHGNYGVLAFDRPNVIAMSYSYNARHLYRGGNKLIAGTINNWMVSGITTWQGGGNLQALSSPNFGLTLRYGSSLPPGVNPGYGSATYYGTTAKISVMPVTTCNPGSGLAKSQHVKADCFAPPAIGTIGPRNYPYLSGPSYTDLDLAITKEFHLKESNIVTFRASAFNWINHPLAGFSSNQQLTLHYDTDYVSKASSLSSSTSPTFGYTDTKTGGNTRRIIQLEVKYSF
jgi:Carboxypeptidase regulatory-like domain